MINLSDIEKISENNFFHSFLLIMAVITPGYVHFFIGNPNNLFVSLDSVKLLFLSIIFSLPLFFINYFILYFSKIRERLEKEEEKFKKAYDKDLASALYNLETLENGEHKEHSYVKKSEIKRYLEYLEKNKKRVLNYSNYTLLFYVSIGMILMSFMGMIFSLLLNGEVSTIILIYICSIMYSFISRFTL